jgi:hypothetical protein
LRAAAVAVEYLFCAAETAPTAKASFKELDWKLEMVVETGLAVMVDPEAEVMEESVEKAAMEDTR